MNSTKIKRLAVKMRDGLFLVFEPLLFALFYIWIAMVLLGWLVYRLVRPAPEDPPCKACGYLHAECPCCSWICPVDDVDDREIQQAVKQE